MFHVGQKVVAIYEADLIILCGPPDGTVESEMPVKGRVYTIRDCYHCGGTDTDSVTLEEIQNLDKYGAEVGFAARLFRPAVGKTTDISCFTDILKTVETPPREKVG